MAPKRTYKTLPTLPESVAESLSEYSPLMQQLLFNRDLCDEVSARTFVEPNYDSDLHDPFLLTDMKKGALRVLQAIQNNEHIIIYTDYDCDGIPGGVLLHDFFTAINYTNFGNYIPHRHEEGYGFNTDAVPTLKERGASLIITVDCGSTDHSAVDEANKLGIDIIITDHHEHAETLPSAYAIINPKRDDAYPFQGICGTAVAYKLVQAILAEGKKKGSITLKDGMEKWWLDLVALATVADMVPLVDENRVLARYGLSVLQKSRRPGLQHLLRKAGGNQRFLTEDDIGFTIAPRINAASRMDDPEDAFHMLRTRDEAEAGSYVLHLEKLNNERKGVVASMTKEAKKRMGVLTELPSVIVMGNPLWRPSLVGLVANALAEEFRRPAFLWGRDGKGILKGSCRSEGTISIIRLMEAAKETFLTFGGHHASGGFSVDHDQIHTLPEALLRAYESLDADAFLAEHNSTVDARITLSDIDEQFVRNLDLLAPFGIGNPKPLFEILDAVPSEVLVFGKAKNHTKIHFKTEKGTLEAISFFKLPHEFKTLPEKDKPLTLIAHVERSYFMGRREIRLRLVDVV